MPDIIRLLSVFLYFLFLHYWISWWKVVVYALGKRLLRHWCCAPLCDSKAIRCRQGAIKLLAECSTSASFADIGSLLHGLPDLEKMLLRWCTISLWFVPTERGWIRQGCRIHTIGNKKRALEHPDSRAVLFEAERYNKRKIVELLAAIDGFDRCCRIVSLLQSCLSECADAVAEKSADTFFRIFVVELIYF